MLRHVLFDMALFDGASKAETENSRDRVLWLLQALTNCNRLYLRQHPETPLIYKSGIKYIVPEQFERANLPQLETVRAFLKKKSASSDVKEALEHLGELCGAGEHFREIPRIIENGGGDCFPLSQKIIVRSRSTGMYELLSIGDLRHVYSAYDALSYNFSTRCQEFKPIIGFVDKGMKPVLKAHLSNGTDLIATADHKFWTLDGSGANGRRLGVRTMGEYVEAMKLSRGMRTARSRILQAARIPALSAVRPSAAEAYLAGIYAAEGNFDGKHTCIAQHKSAVRDKIEASLTEVNTSYRYRSGHGKTPGSGAYYALHGGAANPVVSMMRGQGSDSFDKKFPQPFLSADADSVAMMLSGHADGDAHRPKPTASQANMSAIYTTSSDELAEQIRLGMLICGRPAHSHYQVNHQGEGHYPIWRLHEYDLARAPKLRSRRELLEDELPDLTYGTVRNAGPAGEAHVGCIEVEDNHNFFLADGTLVSNCDNVAAWRCAELLELGIPASPYITWRKRPDGGTTYHVIVRYSSDGSSEDPSLLLGMGGADRAADRAEEERKLAERMTDFMSGDLSSTLGPDLNKRQSEGETVLGAAITTPQDFNQLQYSIPFQTDDSYEDWSPTRPQGFYANPLFPNLPSTPGGMPIFNTRMRDPDEMDWDDRFDSDRFDGVILPSANIIGWRGRRRTRRRAA